jgi:hypothetical protein
MQLTKTIKIRHVLALALAMGAVHSLAVRGDDLFQMYWRGAIYWKNSAGQIVRTPYTEQSFVNTVAANNGLNPSTLVFVYRPNRHDTVVVNASTGAFVADVIQMEYTHTDIVNASNTQIVRQAFLYDEAHQTALGSAAGGEYISRTSGGGIANDFFTGAFQYSKPEIPAVYVGTFWTGQRIVDRTGTPP